MQAYYLVTEHSPGEGFGVASSPNGVTDWTDHGYVWHSPDWGDHQWWEGTGAIWRAPDFNKTVRLDLPPATMSAPVCPLCRDPSNSVCEGAHSGGRVCCPVGLRVFNRQSHTPVFPCLAGPVHHQLLEMPGQVSADHVCRKLRLDPLGPTGPVQRDLL
jgi:hypothetical protein